MAKISVVLPCLNESENIPLLIPQIIKNIPKKYSYEIICVDDGSTDGTDIILRKLTSKNKNIKALLFHRRFGHQAALRGGLKFAKGDAVIMMDSDFQHPPKAIPKMIKLWEKGHDLVRTQKLEDQSMNTLKKIIRNWGYAIWRYTTDGLIIPGGSDFRLVSKEVVKYLNKSPENDIFLRGSVGLISNNPAVVKYHVGKRLHGRSSYSLVDLSNMFLRGFVSFSPKPLRIAFFIGLILVIFSTIFFVYDIFVAIATQRKIIEGWTTVVILTILLNAFTILYLGILGEYIGVIFKETKNRPTYLIDKKINIK